MISLRGTITATQTANFTARTLDITDSFKGTETSTANRALVGDNQAVPNASVINEQALSK
jgi:hypothetical protein